MPKMVQTINQLY